MTRIDIKDKDPFANADAEPKDDISAFGFIMRAALRYVRITIIFYIIMALIYYFVFGSVLDFGLI
ncbi:MAG: hypothetical protein VYE50_00850 [Candidatus Thermoplasmatota archaeon]|jgi:hypothetical protein|nr:hypothetical protein [Candidatus Thermoplasmatota archaeon]MED6305749.1 hypothetical protein [Candidatus Thermoplasmatota archaeon]MEE3242481.1 hypothetical protein [Candidatus Thermoplasmatota archaeon]